MLIILSAVLHVLVLYLVLLISLLSMSGWLVRMSPLCEGEVIVQGDEGPVRGVAQVVDCHGVTVGHQEREEVEERQEVESDGEKTLKERCACPWMG